MKKNVAKCLLNVFLTEDEVLMCYKDSDQNISARSLTLLTFALVWALCGVVDHNPNTTQTRVRDL